MHLSKVMAINTFDCDPRPSLWWWRAPADSSYIEAKSFSPPGSEVVVAGSNHKLRRIVVWFT